MAAALVVVLPLTGYTLKDLTSRRSAPRDVVTMGTDVTSAVPRPDTVLQNSTVLGAPQWSLQSATCRPAKATTAHLEPVRAVALSPDGSTLLSGSAEGAVRIWNVDGGDCTAVEQLVLDDAPSAILGLGDNATFVVGTATGSLHVVRNTRGSWSIVNSRVGAHAAQILGLVELGDGVVATGATDRLVLKWSVGDGLDPRPFTSLSPAPGPVAGLALLDDATIAAALLDGPIVAIDVRSGAMEPLLDQLAQATAVAPLVGGDVLVAGDRNVWIPGAHRDGPLARDATAGWRAVNAVATAPGDDGHTLAVVAGSSPNGNGPLAILDVVDRRRHQALTPDVMGDSPVLSVAAARLVAAEPSFVFVSGEQDGTVRAYLLDVAN